MDGSPTSCTRCGASFGRKLTGGLCSACLLEEGFPTTTLVSEPDLAPGFLADRPLLQQFGPYELLEEIGRGGMGVIYKARQPGLDRLVALKMLLAGEFADAKARERLLREARIAARLTHPGIVTIHDVGEHQGRPYFTMEYVPGRNLAQHCRDGLLPLETVVRYVEQLARAVHYAHQHGVIHRDLKPANVLISLDDEPKLTDFGLTKSLVDQTKTMESAGSPNFMAPEQADPKLGVTGTPTDVFGLGAILYHLLTDRPPSVGETLNETLRAAAACEPVAPRQLRPALPRDLETIALKCLERDPERRYGSALEVAEELARWRNHEPIQARPASPTERLTKWVRRRPVVASLGAACLLALLAGFAGVTWQWRRAEAQAEATARANYSATLALVQQRLIEGVDPAARRLLYSLPERFRGWEWGRLLHRAHREIFAAPVLTNDWSGPLDASNPGGLFAHVLSPDHRWAACWGDGRFEVLNLTNQESVFRLGSSTNRVRQAAFNPSGSRLATIGPGPGLTLWECGTWRKLGQWATHHAPPVSLAYSPDGRWLAIADGTPEVRLYEAETGRESTVLVGPASSYREARFTPDGGRVVGRTREPDQSVRFTLWRAASGQVETEVPRQGGPFRSVELTRDATLYATVGPHGVAAAWRVGEDTPYFSTPPDGGEIVKAIVAADPPRLVTLRQPAGQVRFWNTESGEPLPLAPVSVQGLSVGSDGRTLISAGNALVRLWDWRTGRSTEALGIWDVAIGGHLDVSPDGRLASALIGHFPTPATLHVWPVHPPDRRLAPDNAAIRTAISPDGETVAMGHLDSRISLWSVRTGERFGWLHGHFRQVNDLAWTADGQTLFSAGGDHTVRRWNVPQRRLEATWNQLTRAVWAVSATDDGKRVAAVDLSGTVALWDGLSGTLLRKWSVEPENALLPVGGVCLSPEGHLAALTGFSEAGVWSTETGKRIHRFSNVGESADFDACGAAFSPDGRRLATVDRSGRLRLWDARSWTVQAVSEASEGAPHLTFSPDGRRLFLTCAQALGINLGEVSVEIHDGLTGAPLASLGRQPGWGTRIAFDGRHQRLLHTVMDGGVPTWGTDLMEALPWRGEEYPERAGEPLEDRVIRFARERSWQRLRQPVPAVDPPGLPPAEPRSNWSSRGPETPPACVDLTPAFNGHLETGWLAGGFLVGANNDLAALPRGVVRLDGVTWDIRGVVVTGQPENASLDRWNFGPVVPDIPVRGPARRLHFLHACADSSHRNPTLAGQVGRYRLHFANGGTADLPLTLGEDIGEWWSDHPQSTCRKGTLAWEGENELASWRGVKVRLFHRAWDNPFPDQEIVSIDLIGEHPMFSCFVVAITRKP